MPADYESTARALSISPSASPPPNPPWSRRLSSQGHSRRRSQASLSARARSAEMMRSAWSSMEALNSQMMATYRRMTPAQKALAIGTVAAGYAVIILAVVYSGRVFDWLAGVSKSWREMPAGWLVVFALVFATAFPPVMGYSTANTLAGFVYGFPLGWPLVAAACTAGSLCAFLVCRTLLRARVERMVGGDPRFVALGQVLRRDGILYLTGIRFCPLPFSLSNGFLATIPSISPGAFALSTALSTPKLLVHVFIGSRLAVLAESGDKMSAGDKLVNYLGMAVGAAVGIAVGWVVYKRTMARAAELARQDDAAVAAEQEEGRAGQGGMSGGASPYLDRDDTLLDPEDAAAIMSDDDLSLWETQVADEEDEDDDDSNEDVGLASGKKGSNRGL